MVKNLPAVRETQARSLVREDPQKKERQPTPASCLENSMDRGAWWPKAHEVENSQT